MTKRTLKSKFTVFMILLLLFGSSGAEEDRLNDENDPDIKCDNGVFIPIWKLGKDFGIKERIFRGILYSVILIYLFVGISQVSERFMESIELITSKEKEVVVHDKVAGTSSTVRVKVWNKTVANLSLMVLGSSAPEILLSVIEIVGDGFQAGSLGPGAIVGSAAFNFFVIIGICMSVIPGLKQQKYTCRLM